MSECTGNGLALTQVRPVLKRASSPKTANTAISDGFLSTTSENMWPA